MNFIKFSIVDGYLMNFTLFLFILLGTTIGKELEIKIDLIYRISGIVKRFNQ